MDHSPSKLLKNFSRNKILSPTNLLKSAGLFSRKKAPSKPFKDFHHEWLEALKHTLLPFLRHSLSAAPSAPRDLPVHHLGGAIISSSDLLSAQVDTVHRHFQAYYHALDLAARHDIAQLLSPDWRSSLEKPFLWFGDLHPSLFTNLLHSFIDGSDRGPASDTTAWRNPSRDLIKKVEQIERGLRLMVPPLVQRARDAQNGFLESVAMDWDANRDREEGPLYGSGRALEAAARVCMEDMAGVFADANRLRSSVLAEIVGAADVYQAAVYLEALGRMLVGMTDEGLIKELEQSKVQFSRGST